MARIAAAMLSFLLLFSILGATQQTTAIAPTQPSDDFARTLAWKAVAAMGGRIPVDLAATGSVQLVAGSKTETATLTVRTRGLDQSSEEIQRADGSTAGIIFSRGEASETAGGVRKAASMELASSSHSPDVPLVLLGAALQDSETIFQYAGKELLDGTPVEHIRFWKSFAAQPALSYLSEFSLKELWLDASLGLPRKLSYTRRAAAGAEPGTLVEVFSSDYRAVDGLLHPFQIRKSLNGTPWATITLTSVNENVGLTDADFPIVSFVKR